MRQRATVGGEKRCAARRVARSAGRRRSRRSASSEQGGGAERCWRVSAAARRRRSGNGGAAAQPSDGYWRGAAAAPPRARASMTTPRPLVTPGATRPGVRRQYSTQAAHCTAVRTYGTPLNASVLRLATMRWKVRLRGAARRAAQQAHAAATRGTKRVVRAHSGDRNRHRASTAPTTPRKLSTRGSTSQERGSDDMAAAARPAAPVARVRRGLRGASRRRAARRWRGSAPAAWRRQVQPVAARRRGGSGAVRRGAARTGPLS